MKKCVDPRGHDWERVTMPDLEHGSGAALAACAREGCGEVGYEMPSENLAQKLGQR